MAIFDNPDDMYKMESEIVNENFIIDNTNYNIVKGGDGSFDYINKNILTNDMRRKFGGWKDKEKRKRVWESISLEDRKRIGKQMGDIYGGNNKLNDDEINLRLKLIENVDLTKIGWVKIVSTILNISHTHAKRFIDKNYGGDIYRRKSPK